MTTLPTSPVSVTPVTSASSLTRVNFSSVNYVKIDVCSQTGIAEGALEKLTISLYPNPASEMIAIDISLNDFKPEMTINVFNNLGKTIKQFQLGSPNSILDLKGWDSGVYFYIINDKYNVLKTGRFIID
ncbi:MAG: T9SS type A sorting domain-containing protein [Bacteroidetes bacterium]|nr:T9SS type A sorting domain-containing protein [Bacteroidota bacterium]